MTKRRLALFLALCMLLSMFSTVAYAEDSGTLTGTALDDFLVGLVSESIVKETVESDVNYAAGKSYDTEAASGFLISCADDGKKLADGIISEKESADYCVAFCGVSSINNVISKTFYLNIINLNIINYIVVLFIDDLA